METVRLWLLIAVSVIVFSPPSSSSAWNNETHMAVAKAAGYAKWYNAAGADMAKLKAGDKENRNMQASLGP